MSTGGSSVETRGEDIFEIRQMSVNYGKVSALKNVSIRVGAGSIVTVLGANGAGKSTLLNAAMGVLPIASGAITFLGQNIIHLPVEMRVSSGLSLVPESRELFGSMSVEDNLKLGAYKRRDSMGESMEEMFALFPRLRERRRQHAETLSGGERQMLAMARALMSKPRLLMLDEPSLGLAPLIVRDVLNIVAELRSKGVSILLIEQNARAALQISDYGYVIENGAVALEGPSGELQDNPDVISMYLGLETRNLH